MPTNSRRQIRFSQKVAIATGCSVQFTATVSGYQAMQQAAERQSLQCRSARGAAP